MWRSSLHKVTTRLSDHQLVLASGTVSYKANVRSVAFQFGCVMSYVSIDILVNTQYLPPSAYTSYRHVAFGAKPYQRGTLDMSAYPEWRSLLLVVACAHQGMLLRELVDRSLHLTDEPNALRQLGD